MGNSIRPLVDRKRCVAAGDDRDFMAGSRVRLRQRELNFFNCSAKDGWNRKEWPQDD